MIIYFDRPLVDSLREVKEQKMQEVECTLYKSLSYFEYFQEYYGKRDELEPYFD